MKEQNSARKSSRRSFTKSIAWSLAAAPFVSGYSPSPKHVAEATETAVHTNNASTMLSPMVFKDHIPPIEISSDSRFSESVTAGVDSGSVFLNTEGNVSEPSAENPRAQFINGKRKIMGV